MATVDQVASTVATAVYNLLVAEWGDNPPAQVGIGTPTGTALSEILGENEAQITIFPLTRGSQNRTSRKPRWVKTSPVDVTLVATVAKQGGGFTITLSGTPVAGYNIHTLVGNPITDAYYQVQSSDTLDTTATAIADAITAAAIYIFGTLVTASATGAVVTVHGPTTLACNIGGSVNMVQEVRRTMVPIQVSVWAPTGPLRNSIGALIENGLGLDFPIPFLRASDQSAIWIRLQKAPDWNNDQSQSSYSLYEWHGIFECEYPTLQSTTGYQVEDVINTFE